VRLWRIGWEETEALATTEGNERVQLLEREFPVRHIDVQMDLIDLEYEENLEELSPPKQRERRADLVLPETDGSSTRRHDDGRQPAHIEVDAGRAQNAPPLPCRPMGLENEDLTGKLPGRGQCLLSLLAASLEVLKRLGQRYWKGAVDAGVADE
jgi:hypothetical protein